MNKKQNLLTFSLLSLIAPTVLHGHSNIFNSFEQMQKDMLNFMEKMTNEMDEMRQSIEQSFDPYLEETNNEKEKIGLSIEQPDETTIKVLVKGITAENLDASFDDNLITISAPQATINIKLDRNHMLHITALNEKKHEAKEDKNETQSYQVYQSHITQYIKDQLDIEKSKIDYNKPEQTLNISIPVINNKKPIPVNIVK